LFFFAYVSFWFGLVWFGGVLVELVKEFFWGNRRKNHFGEKEKEKVKIPLH